jgi:predicted AAA+ superfamily ATPase
MARKLEGAMQRDIEKVLADWKENENRKPLLIRGARQVGKTYTVMKFGRENFERVLEVNFERQPEMQRVFEKPDPGRIVQTLEVLTGQSLEAGKSLLFLDEIQRCPPAITALRYFREQMPERHVLAAGSLVDFCLRAPELSMPVGRIQYLFLPPLTFEEFLDAMGLPTLRGYLQQARLSDGIDAPIHDELIRHLRTYLLVGGMPEAIQVYLDSHSLVDVGRVQASLLQTYRDDFGKYAGLARFEQLQKMFLAAPALVGQRFKYVNVSREDRSRELKEALLMLEKARVLMRVRATSGQGLPMEVHADENKFKLLFLDVGLMQHACGLDSQLAVADDFLSVQAGAVAEQWVGQEMLAAGDPYEERRLYFWARESRNSLAEVDYLAASGSRIFPVEVKAGKTGRLKSLKLFMAEYSCPVGVRISQQPLSYFDQILSIPLYAVSQMPRWIREAAAG